MKDKMSIPGRQAPDRPARPKLKILLVEDDPDDAELIALALEDGGIDAEFSRVDTAAAMNDVLATAGFDAILSDYAIPGFGARQALEVIKSHGQDIPFIIVSGEIGEATAVALMKAGVADYVSKGNLSRLPPALERELREAETRRARRAAEQSLRASQQRYESLIQSIDGIVWEAVGVPGPFRFVSQQAEKLLGYPPERWLNEGDFWRANIHPEDQAWVSATYADSVASGSGFQLEYRRTTRQGAIRWFRDVVSVIDGDGEQPRLRGITFDVTERRAVEDERERLLRLAEQRAAEMSTIASLGAAVRTATSRYEIIDLVLATLRQLQPFLAFSYHGCLDETIGPKEQSAGNWPEAWIPYLDDQDALSAQLIGAYEPVVLNPPFENVEPGYGRLLAFPLRAQGNLVGVLLGHYAPYAAHETSGGALSAAEIRLFTALADSIAGALYRAELYEETQIMARQMEAMMMSTPQGLVLLDENRRILLANPVARNALAILAPESAQDPLTRLGPKPLDLHSDDAGPGEIHFQVSTDPADGRTRTYETFLRRVESDRIRQSWLLSLNDVTDERLAQQRIQEQDRLAAVGQLAAGIAHDFNNSLGIIRLYTELVQRHADLAQRDRERLHTVSKQIGHATQLIHQILDFSRRSIMELRPLDLQQLVADMVAILSHTLGSKVEVEYAHASRACTILADKTRIQQAIFNLVVNARDAMPDGGRISCDLQTHTVYPHSEPVFNELTAGDWVSLAITDTGHGIEDCHLNQIFEPFFTTKPTGHGTGLGLAQVYGIVKQHSGYIAVDSQVGKGTRFTLYFPLSSESGDTQVDDAAEVKEMSQRKLLLVEDDPAGREAMRETLQESGYLVTTAENGEDALTAVLADPLGFDLIVSDLVMPKMSGSELVHQLKIRQIGLPVIVITGYPLADGGQGLLEAGVVDWLAKPFHTDALIQKIEGALQP